MSALSEFLARVPNLVDHAAVAVAAIGGVLAARGKQIDLFGVLVLALVTAFGGGTVRDLMIGDLPVAWLRDLPLVATAAGATVVTFAVARVCELPRNLLLIADAFALALFTTSGAEKALGFEVAPVIAVVMGVITGVAGGIIRDVLTGQIPLVFQPHIHLYATAALLGATVFVGLAQVPGLAHASLAIGSAVTLLLRLAAIRWKLALPVFSHAETRELAPFARETNSPTKP
ncbi:MAG: hypothetical protein QOE70_4681 [Chthoniobacter sp.]|jgi:uncharacterized membrane protein YeiH|nr:hypothetical protein [Chthoniobacter sp.]